jgi:hypothetical protein
MSSLQAPSVLYHFVKFLSESKDDISPYANILYTACISSANLPDDFNMRMAMDEIIRCVITIEDNIDAESGSKEVCLDICDILYQNVSTNITDKIDQYTPTA